MCDNQSYLNDYKEIHAKKFSEYIKKKEKQDSEENIIKEKIKQEEQMKIMIENEEKLIKEIQYNESFDSFIDQLNIMKKDIQNANSIIEIDLIIVIIISLMENNSLFLEDKNNEYSKNTINLSIIQIIDNINLNEKSKFDITIKNDNYLAARRIQDNIKYLLKIIDYDDPINIELMDTSNDEKFAKKIHEKINSNLTKIIDDEEVARKIYEEENNIINGKFKEIINEEDFKYTNSANNLIYNQYNNGIDDNDDEYIELLQYHNNSNK